MTEGSEKKVLQQDREKFLEKLFIVVIDEMMPEFYVEKYISFEVAFSDHSY